MIIFKPMLLCMSLLCNITPVTNNANTSVTIMKEAMPQQLYRVVSPEEWEQSKSQQFLVTSPFDEQFIHLATKEQLPNITKKFWNNKPYLVLTLDPKKLIGRLVLETNPGGSTKYYHLYEGKIPLDAITSVKNVPTEGSVNE